jgi:hypothetical protein
VQSSPHHHKHQQYTHPQQQQQQQQQQQHPGHMLDPSLPHSSFERRSIGVDAHADFPPPPPSPPSPPSANASVLMDSFMLELK